MIDYRLTGFHQDGYEGIGLYDLVLLEEDRSQLIDNGPLPEDVKYPMLCVVTDVLDDVYDWAGGIAEDAIAVMLEKVPLDPTAQQAIREYVRQELRADRDVRELRGWGWSVENA